jgi:hypothetical protein
MAARRVVPFSSEISALTCPTRHTPHIENIGENAVLSNTETADSASKNPAATAIANGAKENPTSFASPYYKMRAESATTLCLAIANCHPDDACQIMDAALDDLGRGQPRPAMFSIMAEATEWAEFATRAEIKAYALACFNRLSPTDRMALVAYTGGRA